MIIRLQYYARLRGAVGGLDIRAEILSRVRDAFAEAGIVIPTPSGDVTLPSRRASSGPSGSTIGLRFAGSIAGRRAVCV